MQGATASQTKLAAFSNSGGLPVLLKLMAATRLMEMKLEWDPLSVFIDDSDKVCRVLLTFFMHVFVLFVCGTTRGLFVYLVRLSDTLKHSLRVSDLVGILK